MALTLKRQKTVGSSFRRSAKMTQIVTDVVREHVERAAFQWAQRDSLSMEDEPDPEAIEWVDTQLEANLDAITIAGAAAWPFVIDAFETYPEKGELFLTTYLALVTSDKKRLTQALRFANVAEDGPKGLCGAFAWLPPSITAPVVREWIDSDDPTKLEAALTALVAHGGHPGDRLAGLLAHSSTRVRGVAKTWANPHRQNV